MGPTALLLLLLALLGAAAGHSHHRSASCAWRLEVIKQQILSKLGLRARPDVSAALPRAVALDTLYRAGEVRPAPASTTLPDAEPDDYYGRTSEVIIFAEPGHTLNGQPLLEFSHFDDLEEQGVSPELRVKVATLWVRVDFRPSVPREFRNGPDRNLTLWLFKVTKLHSNATHLSGKEFDEYTEMAASLPLTLSALGWQKFELTSTVRAWYASRKASRERLRLLVDCSGCSDMVEAVLFQAHRPTDGGSNDTQRPFLVVHTDPTATRRVRRRALDCTGAPPQGQCCKQPFYVSFKQIGWEDWIIAPSGYYANYCRGDCGGVHRTPDTFLNYYTHMIEEYRKSDSFPGSQPCCAPLKFSSMSLIYWGPDRKIIKRDLPKMIVDECGCP